jgi:hypothetical protein
MNTNNLLRYFSYVANVSYNQTKELFELCGNDFEMLMEMQAKRKKFSIFTCPADKDALDEVLSKPL